MGPAQLLAQVKQKLWGIWQTHSSQLKLNEWSHYQPQLLPLALSETLLIRDMWCAHKSVPLLAPFSLACKGKLRSRSASACLSELFSDADLPVLHLPHPQHNPLRGSVPLLNLPLQAFSCSGNSLVGKHVVCWCWQSCTGCKHHLKHLRYNNKKNICMSVKWRMFVHWRRELWYRYHWKF